MNWMKEMIFNNHKIQRNEEDTVKRDSILEEH